MKNKMKMKMRASSSHLPVSPPAWPAPVPHLGRDSNSKFRVGIASCQRAANSRALGYNIELACNTKSARAADHCHHQKSKNIRP